MAKKKQKWVCYSVVCGRVLYSAEKPKDTRFEQNAHVCRFIKADECSADNTVSKCWRPGHNDCPYISHWRCP